MQIKPYKWVIIKIEDTYKVFATFNGSYLNGGAWRTNSGIVKVEEFEDYYLFHGVTGSIYKCAKDNYGSTLYGSDILESWKKKLSFQIMDEKFDPTMLNNISFNKLAS